MAVSLWTRTHQRRTEMSPEGMSAGRPEGELPVSSSERHCSGRSMLGWPCWGGRCPPPPHWEPAFPPQSSQTEKPGARGVHMPKVDGNQWEAVSCLQRWKKDFSKPDRPSISQSLPVPEELSPHLCEQPADLTLAEQVGAAGRERGVHSSSMCLDDLHTHETHGQSAPMPGEEGLWSPVRQHFIIPTMYVHSVFPKVWTNYQLYLWAFPPSTTEQKWTLSPISSELLEEEWDALFLRQSAVDVLDKPADLSCGVSHVSGGRLNPDPRPRCHEHFPCWDSKKGVRHCQLVPGARSTAFKKLYS